MVDQKICLLYMKCRTKSNNISGSTKGELLLSRPSGFHYSKKMLSLVFNNQRYKVSYNEATAFTEQSTVKNHLYQSYVPL